MIAPGAARREREPVPLAERGEEEAEEAAERGIRRQVGVQGVAREQQRRAFAVEALLGERAHGCSAIRRELAQAARAEAGQQRTPARTGGTGVVRPRRSRLDARPEPHQLAPGVAVARCVVVE